METEEPILCRLCGETAKDFTEIYGAEGLSKDLPSKINTYLPVTVNELDKLSLFCCYNCISMVLAWHELVLKSVEVDQKLKTAQELMQKSLIAKGCNQVKNEDLEVEFALEDDRPNPEPTTTSLSAFCHDTDVTAVSDNLKKEDLKKEETTVNEECYEEEFTFDLQNETVDTDVSEEEVHLIEDDDQTNENEKTKETPLVQDKPTDIEVHESEELDKTTKQNKQRKNKKLDYDMVNSAKVIVEDRIYYNCKVCGKSLHSPYTYIWHMRIHTGERPYVCDLCGKQFRVSQGLVRHLRETHEGIKNFGCDLCGRKFATRRNVEEHRRIHTNERPYICDLCGKSFKQKASLFVHNRSHKDSFPYRCTHCNQGFRTKPPLLIHITRHTGERPYPCDYCGRRFRIKYEMKRHKLIHSEEKPFSCTDCGLSFRQKRYLRNHNRVNHNRPTDV